MKVFLITKEPFPNGQAATNRIKAYAKACIREGVDCEVLIYTRTEIYGRDPRNTQGHGIVDGISYRYLKGSPLRESNVIIRRWHDIMDFMRLKYYLSHNCNAGDVIFAYDKNFKINDIIQIAHNKNALLIQELCELPFGTSRETSKTIERRAKFEKKIMPKLDGMIAISDALMEYAQKHCNESCNIFKVPILVDFPKYDMQDRSAESPTPYIFHSGTLYEQKDGFLSMLRAFGKVVSQLPFEVKFISTGKPDGTTHEQEIKDIIEEYGLENRVIFTGYLSDEELKEYLSKASFVIINKLTTQQNIYCFSTKLGEYMAASKAILITNVGEAMNWLTHGKDAYIIPPNDIDKLADAMKVMFENPELRAKLGESAHETCRKSFSIEHNAPKFISALRNVKVH